MTLWFYLSILPTFGGALWEKIRTRANFEKTLPSYLLLESLINVVFFFLVTKWVENVCVSLNKWENKEMKRDIASYFIL